MSELEFGESPVPSVFWYYQAGLYHTENYGFESWQGTGWKIFAENIHEVIFPTKSIDIYCLKCSRESVFDPVQKRNDWFNGSKSNPITKNGVHYAHFKCSRSYCRSNLYFVFNIAGPEITKIGQYPSIADLLMPEIKRYRAVLDSTLISDWQRAVGLRAHGIGAGSYVYLRRIIENMINQAAENFFKNNIDSQDDFQKARWPDKIKMLTGYLPNYLVENASVYSVLSKGVHELSEDECNDYFSVMNTSLEIICDEKLAQIEHEKKIKAGSNALQKILQQIKS